jgi:2-methylcitrate dehydratase
MTWQRDLAWENIEQSYRASPSYQFARYALAVNYEVLPDEVVHQAKRCLLDALGCAIGAYDAPGRPICEALVQEMGGPDEATLFGSGIRTSALNASLANAFLVRFLDYNDLGGGSHNSDAIASLLAVCEREKGNGRDLLTAIVISYELGARVSESIIGGNWATRGICPDTRGALSMPPPLGKLMCLNEDQIANAMGICGSHSIPLNILDGHKEEFVMAKNLRFGWVAHDAILSCLLAKKGFTGPVRIVEGDSGFREVVLKGDMDLDKLTDFGGWRILQTRFKFICTNATTQGHVMATLAIVKENDLKPEDIESVRIKTGLRESKHTTAPPKRYPRNAETADHSAFFDNAIAIKDRSFGPETFEPSKFTDPVILDLIERITVEPDLSIPEWGKQGISEITTKDGRKFTKRVDNPHGFGNDPLTDQELETKFKAMAIKYMPRTQIKRLFETIWNIEKSDDIRKLTKLMIFPQK